MPKPRARLRTYKKLRQQGYAWSRTLGNWQPFLETLLGDSRGPRKIVRRQIHRGIGKVFSKQLFGNGLIGKLIKALVGL